MSKTPRAIKRLLNAKRRTGLKYYPHGVMVTIPNAATGDALKLTFKGAFTRKKLRRMINASLVNRLTMIQMDWLIDNYAVKLRPVSADEVNAMMRAVQDEADAED